MKVLLIAANRFTVPYPVYPIGLDFVAGALENHNHKIRILDLGLEEDLHAIPRSIKEFQPDIIGLSIRNVDTSDSTDPLEFISSHQDIVKIIRSATDAKIILGGSGFSIFPLAMLTKIGADYGLLGEGERFPLVLEALEKGNVVRNISGVVTPDMKEVSFPKPWQGKCHRLINTNQSVIGYYLEKGGMMNLQTKRGCPFKCTYCSYPLIEGSKLRLFEPKEIALQAKSLEDIGAKYLSITDSSFNSSIEHSLAIVEAFKKHRLSIPWGAYFTPYRMPDDYLKRIADAGATHIEFGTDSFCDKTLAGLRKPFHVEDIFRSHASCIEAGINAAHYFILGGPGENEATLNETFQNIGRLEKSANFFFCGVRIYPNTPLHQLAIDEGKISPDADVLHPVFYLSDDLSMEQLYDLAKKGSDSRKNWVVGAGGKNMNRVIRRLHKHGYTGPLWENLNL